MFISIYSNAPKDITSLSIHQIPFQTLVLSYDDIIAEMHIVNAKSSAVGGKLCTFYYP